jgi:hypothetical protein
VTAVRIAHVEPWPGRGADGGFAISEFLIVLADDANRRALPLWLTGSDGDSLWQLLDQPTAEAGMAGVAEELAGRMLHAGHITVTAVDIEELDTEVTVPLRHPPSSSPPSAAATARIELGRPGGIRHFTARLGYSLALAVATGAPVRVADAVLDRLAVPVAGDDLLGPFLGRVPVPAAARPGPRMRFEPRNLAFADGLDRWQFGGSFRRGASESHWQDYSCTAGERSAILCSAVPEPCGSAGLQQMIAADDYRGTAVVFRGELRTEDVADKAGLHLQVGPPLGPREHALPFPPKRVIRTVTSSHDWTVHEVTAEVPGDAGIIMFGMFLVGRGRVELRNAELTRES